MDRLVARIMQDFSLDLYEPIYPRALDLGTPLLPRAGNLVSVVVGMRRSGKTYRLFQEMRRLLDDGVPPAQMLYFNFEDDRLKPLTSAVGDAVLDTFFELHPEAHERGAYLFLDEVQEIEDWGTWLRRIIDTKKVTVYATGSSSKLLSADVATAFRGRSVEYELLPMSFGEFVRCHEPEVFGRGSLDGDEQRPRRLRSPAVQALSGARRLSRCSGPRRRSGRHGPAVLCPAGGGAGRHRAPQYGQSADGEPVRSARPGDERSRAVAAQGGERHALRGLGHQPRGPFRRAALFRGRVSGGDGEALFARFGRQRALPREGVRHRSRFGVREFLRSQRRRGAKAGRCGVSGVAPAARAAPHGRHSLAQDGEKRL